MGTVERLLRRDRAILIATIGAIFAIAAVYTVMGVGMSMSALEMTAMAGTAGMGEGLMAPAAWSPSYALLVFLMWWVMMVAMMLPSVAPMILLYAALIRRGDGAAAAPALAAVFLGGYLVVWAGFSLIATALQWGLELRGLVSPGLMAMTSDLLGGVVMLSAGLYQFTPLKDACLEHCRHPAQFIAERRRPGLSGALRMGIEHGAFCLGCCWFLMGLLFVGGIMNLYWIAGLALFVLIEKVLPNGDRFARIAGAGLSLWGTVLLARGLGAV